MKKFTKFMLSAVAMAAVSASFAISAMAVDTVTGTYDPTTGVVSLSSVVSSGDQQTLLVLNDNVAVTSSNASTVIAQIDQAGSISSFVLPTGLSSGTYYIRIGGSNGTLQTGTLTLTSSGGGDETATIIVGDVDGDDFADTTDAILVLVYEANDYEVTEYSANCGIEVQGTDSETYMIGDVDGDVFADTTDAILILVYEANDYEVTEYSANCGEELEVYASEE